MTMRNEPGCLVQGLWLLFVGWWLSGIAISAAWALNNTIIGLPIGLTILNYLPMIVALQSPRSTLAGQELRQRPFLVRAAWFLLVGWWWSGIWLGIAWLLSITIVLLPVALDMVRRAPFMTTLKRY